ncbi:MAG TPA: hypothetical protein VE177_04890, partial [Candidatus Binatus sp.]|nr:hypothetical protein [Candidatus Binatus sp.]
MPSSRVGQAARGLLVLKVILSTVLLAYAATSPITTTSYRALIGGQLSVVSAAALSSADRGFLKASSSLAANGASCPGTPVQFGVA